MNWGKSNSPVVEWLNKGLMSLWRRRPVIPVAATMEPLTSNVEPLTSNVEPLTYTMDPLTPTMDPSTSTVEPGHTCGRHCRCRRRRLPPCGLEHLNCTEGGARRDIRDLGQLRHFGVRAPPVPQVRLDQSDAAYE
eukprot:639054-Pyramimonas_sp.AAC.2